MSGSNRLGSPNPSTILTIPVFAKVRTVLFTVSNEMLGKIVLALLNMVSAEGWSFDLHNSLYITMRCGVILRLCSLHLSRKKSIKPLLLFVVM